MKYIQLTTMQFKVTRLKIQKPRKGEMWTRNASLNTGGAVGSIRGTDGTSVTTSRTRSTPIHTHFAGFSVHIRTHSLHRQPSFQI